MDFANQIVAMGGRPPQRKIENFIGMQWFYLLFTWTNADVTAIDLKPLFDTDPTIAQRFSSSLPDAPDLVVHMEQVQIVAFDGATAALTLAEKDKLVEGTQLYVKQDSSADGYALGPHITELYIDQTVSVDSDDASASVQRGALNGPPLILPAPLTLDLANDTLQIQFSTATPASPGKAFFKFYGAVTRGTLSGNKLVLGKSGNSVPCKGGRIADEEAIAAFERATGMGKARAMGIGPRAKG